MTKKTTEKQPETTSQQVAEDSQLDTDAVLDTIIKTAKPYELVMRVLDERFEDINLEQYSEIRKAVVECRKKHVEVKLNLLNHPKMEFKYEDNH